MPKAAIAIVLLLAAPLPAQPTTSPPGSRAERFLQNCDGSDAWDVDVFCEVRDVTIRAPQRSLVVDGRQNGSVRVFGWDRSDVFVRALIQARADSRDEARGLAREVTVETDGDRVRADGPSSRRRRSWSASFEVWVPRQTSLDAEMTNGGVTVEGVEGRLDLRAVNGSISIRDVSGDVRGQTANGSVNAVLDGSGWKGAGLELVTSNGSVNLEIPRGYNALLETGTINGSMSTDFPLTVQGFIGRRITTTLGSGGRRVRAVTTNGSVRIRQR